jgi:flagellar hook-associated protein FlgK
MVVPKYPSVSTKRPPATSQTTRDGENGSSGEKKKKRAKKGEESEEEDKEKETAAGTTVVSESESSPRGKEKEEEEEEERGGVTPEEKTPMKEEEEREGIAAKEGIDIPLHPNVDPRVREEIENVYSEMAAVLHRMDAHAELTMEHLDMVKKALRDRKDAAKDKLVDIFKETFTKLANIANESMELDEKIKAVRDTIANLRQSIGA